MRVLSTVVQVPVLAVFHTGQNLTNSRSIAAELIGDDHAGPVGQPLQQLPKKCLCSSFISATLHEDVEDIPVLVDGSPEVVPFPLDGQKDLIHMPLIAESGVPAEQLMRIDLTELPTPIARGFVGQRHAVHAADGGCHSSITRWDFASSITLGDGGAQPWGGTSAPVFRLFRASAPSLRLVCEYDGARCHVVAPVGHIDHRTIANRANTDSVG
jgi:hypothetical protein